MIDERENEEERQQKKESLINKHNEEVSVLDNRLAKGKKEK